VGQLAYNNSNSQLSIVFTFVSRDEVVTSDVNGQRLQRTSLSPVAFVRNWNTSV